MELFIVRHAWAEDRDATRWPDDDLRPLSKEGQKRFADYAKLLVARGAAPRVIATSPLVRCRQTADLLAAAMPKRPKVVELDSLRPHSDIRESLQWAADQARVERIAWVSHSPDVGQWTAALIGQAEASIRFAKGAVAAVEFDGPPALGSGSLLWLATAKLLGC